MMDKDGKEKIPDYDVFKASSDILKNHGKSDAEIMAFLEEQFPVSATIMDKILKSRMDKHE